MGRDVCYVTLIPITEFFIGVSLVLRTQRANVQRQALMQFPRFLQVIGKRHRASRQCPYSLQRHCELVGLFSHLVPQWKRRLITHHQGLGTEIEGMRRLPSGWPPKTIARVGL